MDKKKPGSENIAELHKMREALLNSIQTCDAQSLKKYKEEILNYPQKDTLNIFKRVPGNMLRSYKNFLLSHNTLYSYSAEKGGLSPEQSHYLSEKYSIMIEHTDNLSQLHTIHVNMIDEYGDPSIRSNQVSHSTIVDKAILYIKMNFAEEVTIEEIAQQLHVHPTHLMRSFKKEMGIKLSHYRNQRRVEEAKELLIYSKLSMTDVAVMVGFKNSQYFSKIFKEEVGMTPKEFKKKHGKSN
ncbi:AraC family transcriptional regulator [Bacillus sp. B15-48]|uniref:AraC family transcriptional regulator n=1 Tax=Bacillus sp. B15-48 TaxID=1548601 RepID=UPI00193F65D0|nr:AraC family transcriptional regulator [Bacillus sp. B15-48]MBM4761126.1 AraC family transcriptional regulator [Bacillus sp. B15-48]